MRRNETSECKIVDSFPLVVNKFGRAYFGKRLREYSSYGYCARKKETYYGMKVHTITDLNENPIDYLLTKANVDDRDALYELSNKISMDTLFRNLISKLLRRIESTFNQLIEHFDIERVRSNSILSLCTMLEIKFLYFNILTEIGNSTKISNVINFSLTQLQMDYFDCHLH